MFQRNHMNQIDNFFMRNNNQVTPKRSYSPRLTQQMQQNHRQTGHHLQYFPANKQNVLPNRNSISPNKVNYTRKPMISNVGTACGNNLSPSLLVSPRSKGSHQGLSIQNNQNHGNYRGFQKQLSRPQLSNMRNQPNIGSTGGLLKRFNPNGSEVQFVMSKGVEYCQNHGNKLAEFSIKIQGQKMKYCSVCASKLASQGFTVVKISQQLQKKQMGRSLRKARPLPSYPQYRNNIFYQQIMQFLGQLVAVQTHHYDTITKFDQLQQHYNNQMDITTQYYDKVLLILQQMKQHHLQDLQLEKQKYLQISDIQIDHINQNVKQIIQMRQDIQSNIPDIVTGIQQASFQQCIYQYRHKMTMLKHSIQQKEDTLKDVTQYTEHGLQKKVKDFQNKMKELWQDDAEQNQNAHPNKGPKVNVNQNSKPQFTQLENKVQFTQLQNKDQVSIKNMHQMLPKSSVQQTHHGQGAFRNLFGDEEDGDQTMPIPSPQFKKI